MQNARPTDTEAKGGKGARLAIMVQSDLSALVEKELEEKRERTIAQEHGPYLKRRNTPVKVDRKSTLTVPNLVEEEEERTTTREYYAGVGTCAAGIIGTLVCYGILQERIMTRPYGERIPNTDTERWVSRNHASEFWTDDGRPSFFWF